MARSEATVRVAMAAWGLLCVPACALDDRTLHPLPPTAEDATTDDTSASSSSGGATAETTTTGSSAGGNSSSAGGASIEGSSTSGALEDNPCPDLNHNLVPDCDETLVLNAGFDAGTEEWTAEAQAELEWQAADSGSTSGSLGVIHSGASPGVTAAGSYQCIEVSPRSKYRFFAHTFIPGGQSDARSALSALFYASDDCSGTPFDVVNSGVQSTPDTWRVLHAEAATVEQAGSVKLRLVVVKAATPAEIRFDNVLLLRE